MVAKQRNNQTTKKGAKTKDDPQIPQPDLRFAKRSNGEATHKRGRGPTQNKNNTKFATKRRGIFPLCQYKKNLQKQNQIMYIHQPDCQSPTENLVYLKKTVLSLRSKIDNYRTAGSHPWKPSILSTTIGWTLSTSWKALLWQSPLWRWWCVYLRWCGSDHCSGHRCELRRPRPCPLRFVQAGAQNTFEWADPGHWSSQPVLSQQHFPW